MTTATQTRNMHRIVIIGGGAGGLELIESCLALRGDAPSGSEYAAHPQGYAHTSDLVAASATANCSCANGSTLAGAGISDARAMYSFQRAHSPLRTSPGVSPACARSALHGERRRTGQRFGDVMRRS